MMYFTTGSKHCTDITVENEPSPPPPKKKKEKKSVARFLNFDFLKLILSIFSQPLLLQNWKSEETGFQEIP